MDQAPAISLNAQPKESMGESSVPLISAERSDFYPWSNSTNQLFKRGTALVFHDETHSSYLAKNFQLALKHLEYTPVLYNLSDMEKTLKNG
jgi:hypothetical protein